MIDKPILALKYIFNREDPIVLSGKLLQVSEYEDEDLTIPEGIDYDFKVWHVGRNIYLHGNSKAKVIHPCDRCLVPVTLLIEGTIDAIYMRKNSNFEGKTLKYKIEESNVNDLANLIYYEGEDKLDFSDRIGESILTEIPSKVLCKEDCEGLCPICGANWNYEKCEHYGKINNNDGIDPRFKILKKYKSEIGE